MTAKKFPLLIGKMYDPAVKRTQAKEQACLLRYRSTSCVKHGKRFSGGQRQRIGITGALYKKADVIIFDEATSALDNETEQAVMQAIEGPCKDLTLLIIAQRLTNLKKCTQIVKLGAGEVNRIGSYQTMVTRTA